MKKIKKNERNLPFAIVINEIFKYVIFKLDRNCNWENLFGYFKIDKFRKIWFLSRNIYLTHVPLNIPIRNDILYLRIERSYYNQLYFTRFDISKFEGLTHLTLHKCRSTGILPVGLSHVTFIDMLNIPDLSNLKRLTHLSVIYCKHLPRCLPTSITHLNLYAQNNLPEWPTNLIYLSLGYSHNRFLVHPSLHTKLPTGLVF